MDPVYFDNAATSWPKPPGVRTAMDEYFGAAGGNPGRSGHRMSIAAARLVEDARALLGRLFNAGDPSRMILTKNATEALNLAICGLAGPGDHVITSSIEHNSVMRPLRYLESFGLELTTVECSPEGTLDPADVAAAFRPNTRLLVTLHGSNVLGTLLPIQNLAQLAAQNGVPYLVDASQTAGAAQIDVQSLGIGLLAFPGHKALLGPTGTGALYIHEGIELKPIMWGGTGSRSDLEFQPDFAPDMYESGTLNVAGLAGLAAGIRHILDIGIESIEAHERSLVGRFLSGAAQIPGLTVHGPPGLDERCGVISFNVDGLAPSDVGVVLDRDFSILSRVGLHCAPGAHRTIGTFPTGSVRFGFGPSNTESEVDVALEALSELCAWADDRSQPDRAGRA
ncbi:MAG: aminotransferase class V-fold PLP-dependent enzyme [Acidimicrobiia bacterium]